VLWDFWSVARRPLMTLFDTPLQEEI